MPTDPAQPMLPAAAPAAEPPSPAPAFVVGIGASAGGLEALEAFFDNMPTGFGLAFVVVQHLSPDFISMMDEILARHTKMAIRVVENEMRVEPDTIYLLPPRMVMALADGHLILSERDTGQVLSLPVDIFLRSLANDAGSRAVAVVLSGGSHGVREVHEAGGLVLAQSPASAKFDSMPAAAIATGHVDQMLNPEAMSSAILRHTRNAPKLSDASPEDGGSGSGSRAAPPARRSTPWPCFLPSMPARRAIRPR